MTQCLLLEQACNESNDTIRSTNVSETVLTIQIDQRFLVPIRLFTFVYSLTFSKYTLEKFLATVTVQNFINLSCLNLVCEADCHNFTKLIATIGFGVCINVK